VGHCLLNFTDGDREQAAALLDAKMWGVGDDEPHRAEIAPGDLVLIYIATRREFIGRAELATSVHEWTPSEAVYPGDSTSGVGLTDVEEWDHAVPMDVVVRRIDPTGSSRLVQENAAKGFRMGVVLVDADEYEAVLALNREARGT
jgi:hypothetical protein